MNGEEEEHVYKADRLARQLMMRDGLFFSPRLYQNLLNKCELTYVILNEAPALSDKPYTLFTPPRVSLKALHRP